MFSDPSMHIEISRLRQSELLAAGESMSPPRRELAQRLSGTEEVLLLWHPASDRVELSVRDLETGVGFEIEVAPGSAIEAFYHPYAYAAKQQDSYPVNRAKTAIVDG